MKIDGSLRTANTSSFTATDSNQEMIVHPTGQVKVRPSEQQQDKHKNVEKQKEETQKNELTREEAKHIVKGMNEFLQPHYTSVSFKLHEELDRYYVEVIDKQTNEVIREIPDKEILDMYAKMTEYLGLFIDEKL